MGQAPLPSDTKSRILDTTERLFIDLGAEAISLRRITAAARVNLAAVNYHFGSKRKLLEALLAQQLDPFHADRLRLLEMCEARWPGPALTCAHVLAALFIPALHRARVQRPDAPSFLRFLGRVYSESSPTILALLQERYDPVAARFFESFAQTLPAIPRAELALRLHFVLKALSGMVATTEFPDLLARFTPDRNVSDAELLACLTNMMVGALTAPSAAEQASAFSEVLALASEPEETRVPAGPPSPGGQARLSSTKDSESWEFGSSSV